MWALFPSPARRFRQRRRHPEIRRRGNSTGKYSREVPSCPDSRRGHHQIAPQHIQPHPTAGPHPDHGSHAAAGQFFHTNGGGGAADAVRGDQHPLSFQPSRPGGIFPVGADKRPDPPAGRLPPPPGRDLPSAARRPPPAPASGRCDTSPANPDPSCLFLLSLSVFPIMLQTQR